MTAKKVPQTESSVVAERKETAQTPGEGTVKETAETQKPENELEQLREYPEKLVVPMRDGYRVTGRKSSFGDRQWIYAQPEGMKLPEQEIMPAACIVSIEKKKRGEKGEAVLDDSGNAVYEAVELDTDVHPWFWLRSLSEEAALVYITKWQQTYGLTNTEVARGLLYANREMKQGNA